MAWKPKEKEMTPEEAILLAKKELAPFWINSSPLITGVKLEKHYSLYSLDKDFEKKPWLIFFIDITSFSGDYSTLVIQEWHRRYSAQPVGFLLVVVPAYSFLVQNKELVKEWLANLRISIPIVIDFDGGMIGSFGTKKLPRFIIFKKGKFVSDFSGEDWYLKSEAELQAFLRETDPGLPLLPLLNLAEGYGSDLIRFEFGFHPRIGMAHPIFQNDFSLADSGHRVYRRIGVRPRVLEAGQLFLSGSWEQDVERIIVSDIGTIVGFHCVGSKVQIIACAMPNVKEHPRIAIEVHGEMMNENDLGEDATLDDQGRAVILLKHVRAYSAIANLSKEKRELTIRFLNADVAPVALYGIRVG